MAGLYLHIPFCRQKCPYCDFYSEAAVDQAALQDYPELLKRHLAWAAEHGWRGPLETVYFGGGTPSLLKPAAVASILGAITQNFSLAKDAEITLEANPGTVSKESLTGYREAGVNRLSLGLQSCNERHLQQLGRLHNCRQGQDAVRWSREAGFENISLDLMFALPGQTFAELTADLDHYLQIAPEHLSCYGLTAEPQTPLQKRIAAGDLALPDEDFYADAYLLIHEQLTAAGYVHYEIANYARAGATCRHNLACWQRRPYLGIGAGAHSFYADEWGSRWQVPADLAAYRQALDESREPLHCLEHFDRQSALRETVYLALRTRWGISDTLLQQRFGCTLQDAFPDALAHSSRWLRHHQGHWSMTPAGWLLFDSLILPFL